MSRLRVASFSVSIDGFGAGPDQSLDNPMGKGGMALHQWAFTTRTFKAMFGQEGGATGDDDAFARRGFDNLGAWILGRNMFGPVRGPWPDESWRGWWDENPPYHVPVFVLTHHARASLVMEGGTTFHFVTGGAQEALDARGRRPTGAMCVLAAAWRRSANISACAPSMRCTSRSHPSRSAPARICSRVSICPRSAIAAPSMCQTAHATHVVFSHDA
ncbi:MAG: hypothetical protein WDM89_01750, partial [Rhizomicrobium sp.]